MASAYLPSRAKISARTYSAGHNLGSMRSASLMLRFSLSTAPFLRCSLASLHNFITFRFASPVATTIGTFPSVTAAQTKVAMKTRKTLRIGLRYQSVCNEKGNSITSENRYSPRDTSDDGHAHRAMPQSSREQRERQRDAEFDENDVPRRERNHPATGVLPPMNSARHFFVGRNVDSAEKPDHEQTEFAEAFPQPESNITELHRHDLPRQGHPHRRSPDHRATADRVIEGMRVIDQPRVSR